MGIKSNVGDVFLVPVTDQIFGIGQVAGNWKGELYIIIYDETYEVTDKVDAKDVYDLSPLLSALSLDAKIYNGDWRIIGNAQENLISIPHPAFKVEQGGRIFVESRDRKFTRLASDEEQKILRFRNVVAPIRLEKALKALRGFAEWSPRFDELRSSYSDESSRIIDEA